MRTTKSKFVSTEMKTLRCLAVIGRGGRLTALSSTSKLPAVHEPWFPRITVPDRFRVPSVSISVSFGTVCKS